MIDEGEVIVLAPASEAQRRIATRVYPLGQLLDLFPELDERQVHDLIVTTITPTDWPDPGVGTFEFLSSFGGSRETGAVAAALPRALLVRHHAAGHAAIERLLAYVETQAKTFPRPYDLVRDDHREAQAALAARLRAAEDPLEVCWLAWMISVVDDPSEELAEALFAQLNAARHRGDFECAASLLGPIAHCGRAVDIEVLLSLLADASTPQLRRKLRAGVFVTLSALGPEGASALGERLNRADKTVSVDERTDLFSLLRHHRSVSRAAMPAVVEQLSHDASFSAGETLKAIDPHGAASRAYIKRRLAEPELSEEERDHLESLSSEIDKLFGTK